MGAVSGTVGGSLGCESSGARKDGLRFRCFRLRFFFRLLFLLPVSVFCRVSPNGRLSNPGVAEALAGVPGERLSAGEGFPANGEIWCDVDCGRDIVRLDS